MTVRRGSALLVVLAVVGILAASVGGYFWWSSYVKTLEDKQSQTLTWEECVKIPGAKQLMIYPGQCIAPDGKKVTQPLSEEEKKKFELERETANWKTYTDGAKTFSFKLPAEYFVHKNVDDDILIASYPIDNPSTQNFLDGQESSVTLTRLYNDTGVSLSTIANYYITQPYSPFRKDYRLINVFGQDAALLEAVDGNQKKIIFVGPNRDNYSVTINVLPGLTLEEKRRIFETFDQILSTFRFD